MPLQRCRFGKTRSCSGFGLLSCHRSPHRPSFIERNKKNPCKTLRKPHPPFKVYGGLASRHRATVWAVHSLPVLANSVRGELGSFTGPVSRSGTQEPANCPKAMAVSISTSLGSLLSPSAVQVLEAAPAAGTPVWDQGFLTSHSAHFRRDCPPASQTSCSTGSTQKQGESGKWWPSVFTSFILRVCSFHSSVQPGKQQCQKMAVQTPLAFSMEELGLAQHRLPNCPRVFQLKDERRGDTPEMVTLPSCQPQLRP